MNKKILVGMAIVIIALAVSAIYLSIKLESNFLHPEHCEVSAVAWWDYNPNELEKSLHMNLTFVELDANATYCFGDVWLNPHNNTLEGTCGVTHGCAWYEGQLEKGISEGDTLHAQSYWFSSETFDDQQRFTFALKDVDMVDVVLPFYILEKVEYDGVMYDHKYVGEIEFSVKVQGEIPPPL